MSYEQIQRVAKSLSAVGVGVVVGTIFTCVAVKLPMMVEANWAEERYIKFDSRAVCEVVETTVL